MAPQPRGWRLLTVGAPLILLVSSVAFIPVFRQPAVVLATTAPTATVAMQDARTQLITAALSKQAAMEAPKSAEPTASPAPAIAVALPSATPTTAPKATMRATARPLSGSTLTERSLHSAVLGRDLSYFIYLPAGYAESGARYPVIYMLHGYGGSNTEWLGYGFPEAADKMMTAGEIPPLIIVLPQGDQAYWVNHAGGEQWGDYTAEEVVPFIDATYRTIPDARHRAVGGLSMGAHGALQLALNYPGVFGVVGMHSPTLRDYRSAQDIFGFWGDEAYFDAHDPVHLVQAYLDRARELKIELDVGAQDVDWRESTVAFHSLLTRLNIPHQWNIWPGIHDGAYWSAHDRDYLRFYAAALSVP